MRNATLEALEMRTLLSAGGHVFRVPYVPANFKALPAVRFAAATPAGLSASPIGLTPTQMRSAYGMGAYGSSPITFKGIQGDGTGQTIAVVDTYDDPTALGDLNAFSTQFGLPSFNAPGDPTFQKFGVNENSTNGGLTSTLPGTDPSGPGFDWEVEESLDIEWAHVMAPDANIILVEASDSGAGLFYGDEFVSEVPGVVAVSNSWSSNEFSGETQDDFIFTTPSGHLGGSATMNGPDLSGGVAFLAATGDSGAYASGTSTIKPQYPADSPNVIAVGGTSLTVDGNSYAGETAWGNGANSGTQGGGGGGISKFESRGSYQVGITNSYSTTKRAYPDISLEADPNAPTGSVPVYDTYDNGTSTPWIEVGGTSLASPMMAGIIAVTDQGRAINGMGSLDGATQVLPRLYALPSTDFHDITSGSIGGTSTYSAKVGYDIASGIGSPVANSLIPQLAFGGAVQISGNNLYIKRDADGTQADLWIDSATPGQGSTYTQQVLLTSAGIAFNGKPGNDTLTLDYSGGDFAASFTAGLTFNGSTSGANAIDFIGTTSSDTLTATANLILPAGGMGTAPIQLWNVQSIHLTGGSGGSDALNINGAPAGGFTVNADTPTGTADVAVNVGGSNVAVAFASTQHLAALAINGAGDVATVSPAATLFFGTESVYGTLSSPYSITAQDAPITVTNMQINGDNPNGLFDAPGQSTPGMQRSMVEDVLYTFSSAVNILDANSAFTVLGTGQYAGTPPASLTATAVPGSHGTQWAVTLTGQAPGVLASIANGTYSITVNPAFIFAASDGVTPLSSGRTDSFFRLFGDINGDGAVNNADLSALKQAFAPAGGTYNPAFDYYNVALISNADLTQFKNDFLVNFNS